MPIPIPIPTSSRRNSDSIVLGVHATGINERKIIPLTTLQLFPNDPIQQYNFDSFDEHEMKTENNNGDDEASDSISLGPDEIEKYGLDDYASNGKTNFIKDNIKHRNSTSMSGVENVMVLSSVTTAAVEKEIDDIEKKMEKENISSIQKKNYSYSQVEKEETSHKYNNSDDIIPLHILFPNTQLLNNNNNNKRHVMEQKYSDDDDDDDDETDNNYNLFSSTITDKFDYVRKLSHNLWIVIAQLLDTPSKAIGLGLACRELNL
ncbi:hypothetical protein RFI_22390, partial [Reticulomyxa filosa]